MYAAAFPSLISSIANQLPFVRSPKRDTYSTTLGAVLYQVWFGEFILASPIVRFNFCFAEDLLKYNKTTFIMLTSKAFENR